MRFFAILFIQIYQLCISSFLLQIVGQKSACRFSKTCSEYAKQAIMKHGIMRGSYLAFIRVLSCQPFSSVNLRFLP